MPNDTSPTPTPAAPQGPKALRADLFRYNPSRTKTIILELEQEDGSVVERAVLLRQPSVAQRDRILAEAQGGNAAAGGKVDGSGLARAQAVAAVLCCLDPETRQPIFTEADIESLTQLPAGTWFDVLAREAMGLMEAAQKSATKSTP